MIVSDAGYRTPAIAHELLEDGIKPLFPYKRPMTKDGFYRKYERSEERRGGTECL